MKMSINSRQIRYQMVLLAITAICLVAGTAQLRAESESKDIVDTAVSAGNFDTLVAAVKAADLVETLKQPGPFTVFAPTDDAFKKLPAKTLKSLLKPNKKGQLSAVLTYHVVPGRVTARDAFGLENAITVNGQRLDIGRQDGKLVIGGATVVATDINCTNGVIHVIDAVLLPQPMGTSQARRTIEDAIRRGVPVFNRGDHGQCAEIYAAACQAIVASASDEVPKSAIRALKTALDRAKDVDDDRSRAWALRGGMDSAWAGLEQEGPASSSTAAGEERLLFAFDKPEAAAKWRTTNDGVMGGRSDGRFKINEEKNMEFFGTLSLANNGGFASVRSSGSNLGLQKGDSIVARVRGDGRKYNLNLYTPARRIAFSYRAEFETKKDEWIEVRVPVDKFVATSFGRVVSNQGPDPSQVNGLGILLGDKKAGPFKLEVEWIKAVKPSA